MADDDLLPAERLLIEAINASKPCVLIDGNSRPTAEEIAQWTDPDRKVRATFLRSVVLGEWAGDPAVGVDLTGAIITGDLDLRGEVVRSKVALNWCRTDRVRLDGAVLTRGAAFTNMNFLTEASFDEAVFTEVATFAGTTFSGAAKFNKVTFPAGAVYFDETSFDGVDFLGTASFSESKFYNNARFGNATFGGTAWFRRTSFAHRADFDKVTFESDAEFDGAIFTGEAKFNWAHFAKRAEFDGAAFTRDAWFNAATLAGEARFPGVTFDGVAWFLNAVFGSTAGFTSETNLAGVQFNQAAKFSNATFAGIANFYQATFDGAAVFDGATFTCEARFKNCAFNTEVWFDKVITKRMSIEESDCHSSDLGTLFILEALHIQRVVFHRRVQIAVLSHELSLEHSEFRGGGHLKVHSAKVELCGTTFGGPSIIAGQSAASVPDRDHRVELRRLSLRELARYTASQAANALYTDIEKLRCARTPACRPARITDIKTASVGDLVLSGVDLEKCTFRGAHGLDTLRIDASCKWPWSPNDWKWRRRPPRITSRRVIAEELSWRREFQKGWDSPRDARDASPPSALEIAELYRDLRKGLEGIKNEPGAADFYYGEMEMRRLSGHEPSTPRVAARSERWLLHAYWALSGYGLRASRAFGALALTILLASAVFACFGFESPAPAVRMADATASSTISNETGAARTEPKQPSAFEFAVRDSLALLRIPSQVPSLTGVGSVTDILLRLVAPVLLALGVLAIRGRTKR